MFLTYFMVNWGEIVQQESDQRCTLCGRSMTKTEPVTDPRGASYVGYVCHPDKQVTWVKVG
jgi:hypothetical protein